MRRPSTRNSRTSPSAWRRFVWAAANPHANATPSAANCCRARDHFGRIFFNQARMSAAAIPQVAAVLGSCTAGGAYIPAMCEESIIVKGQGTIFLAGPPLVKAATGEVVSAEDLGGADTHARQSGVADYYATDDTQALAMVRRIIASLGTREKAVPLANEARPPHYDPAELDGVVPPTFA